MCRTVLRVYYSNWQRRPAGEGQPPTGAIACGHSHADRMPIEVAPAGISAPDSKGCARRGCRLRAMVATREATGGRAHHYRLRRAAITVVKVVVMGTWKRNCKDYLADKAKQKLGEA
ncbi:hypothetical protein BHE74_00041989 [Ensete ventricosum]|nr:hypothetical protein GW17_00049957 [Ensete ventricosum]RWW51645.1 hypothetical protein BHE74_00041989 [Ensete ventricosum]